MHVQDPLRYDVNITAEISNEQIDMFQECCLIFYHHLKNCITMSPSNFELAVNADLEPISSSSYEEKRWKLYEAPQSHRNIESNELFREIFSVSASLLTRSEERIQYEKQIMDVLEMYVKSFDSTLNIVSFGSTTYGFGGSNTNFNILIDAGICDL